MKNKVKTTENYPLKLRLRGPLDRWAVIKIRFRLLMPLARGCKRIILDLRRAAFVDSDGIKLITSLVQDHPDVKVSVVNSNPKVKRTLSLARLDHLVLTGA